MNSALKTPVVVVMMTMMMMIMMTYHSDIEGYGGGTN